MPTPIRSSKHPLQAVTVTVVGLLMLSGGSYPLRAIQRDDRTAELQLRRVTTIADPNGRIGLATWGSVALAVIDRQGRIFIPNAYTAAEISVFDMTGTLLERVGRSGQGPGEFGEIQLLDTDADGRLHVFDLQNRRHVTLSENFEVVSTQPVGTPMNYTGVVRFPGDTLVLNFHVPQAATVGMPIHVLDGAGQRVRSMGQGSVRPDQSSLSHLRHLVHAGPRRFWAAHVNQYLIEVWNLDGVKEREIRRDVEWFQPWFQSQALRTPTDPPQPMVSDFRSRADGRLLVLIHVPDKRWRSALRPSNSGFGGYDPDPVEEYYDTIIELLDEGSGKLIASVRVDDYLVAFGDDDHVLGYGERDLEPFAEVFRIVLPETK